ncbi:unnamed protein product [Schistocephalus solidus]|uniref:Very-long-chain (3R)-3-hydroxyacyl-CoA dehydratase n=1 Tax=Schistocephalus solidus TaxID=70667 RepID=A0A183TS88_SCHSO|nr:unnamed protein product [Schistocephalus solidus]
MSKASIQTPSTPLWTRKAAVASPLAPVSCQLYIQTDSVKVKLPSDLILTDLLCAIIVVYVHLAGFVHDPARCWQSYLTLLCNPLSMNCVLSLPDMKSEAYTLVADRMLIVQLASFLEIVHASMGWVRSSVLATALQVLGRNLVFFLILVPHAEVQEDTAVFTLFITWSMIELLRYPYYVLRIFDEKFGLLTYLRYTAWIPLYPIGFMCEGQFYVYFFLEFLAVSVSITIDTLFFCL